ncbi:kinesin-like protein KIFC3 isoform X2 [Eucyclogobius newberryi]|uniref:kinesin-like protein KIFC3 isoform X2 n=1 Tax=Eucyclogobius newberryi TaxID=166745 RepID=UPI003B5AA9A3
MYVLCTLVALTVHSLLKNRNKAVERRPDAEEKAATRRGAGRPKDGTTPWVLGPGKDCGISINKPRLKRRRETAINVQNGRRKGRPVQRSSALLSPAVMFGTRKTWDLGHAPCLQELWKNNISLDASSVDFLMSDGEEDGSFLSLPTSAFPRRASVSSELNETSSPTQHLLIQKVTWSCLWTSATTLQEKVCEFQARLRAEEVTRHLLLQQLQQQNAEGKTTVDSPQNSPPPARCNGVPLSEPSKSDHSSPEKEQLVTRLHTQVEELEEKLLDQTQEVERLRSELGATDLEKQLERLVVENQRLKQELKTYKSSDPGSENCPICPHSQNAETLQREVSRWENQARQRERRLAELERDLQEKSQKVESLHRELDQATRQLQESERSQTQAERKLSLRIQECEEELHRQATAPPRVKYVTQTVEVQSADSQKVLSELQGKNSALQEQVSVQRQLLRELETQLHDSQRTCTQLRTQILVYEGEMERAQGRLEVEMQNLEDEKNRVIEEAFIRAECEMKTVHQNLAGVRMNLMSLQPALRTLTSDYNSLKKQVQEFPFMLDKAIAEAKQEICQVISEVSSTNQELLRKYKREMNLRKKCHNELVRLKGNIRVFCRVRPVSQEEQDSTDAKTMLSFDSDDDSILYLSNKGKVMTFELDRVFPPKATQEEVFQEVQSLVTSCIDGFNVCIFAYGQTGSGKTYTMEGVAENPGINQRALQLLFSEVTEKASDWDYTISASMVEIYNETLRDLLGDSPTEKLDIKMQPDGSGQLYVPGLTKFTVGSAQDINRIFELGHVNRATACTNLNEHSSRSHALLVITVSGYNATTATHTQGKLNLVDLAGSERISKSGAEGSRLREAQYINKSLSALGDVINALRGKHSHVPFRNSRLTYLLQDSLSGDSKTLMMVQVSPLSSNMSESVCSLKFAQRVRTVELSSSSSSSRRHENSSTSSSPTHDSVELDSPPSTPGPLPISRASSAGSTLSTLSTLSTASRTASGSRRRSQSQLSAGVSPICSSLSPFCGLIGRCADKQLDRASPLVDGGQDD